MSCKSFYKLLSQLESDDKLRDSDLEEERYFYALSCACDKEENKNPHEKLNFRPSANSTLH